MHLLSHFHLSFPCTALVLALSKVAENGEKMLLCTLSSTKLFGEVLYYVGNEDGYEKEKLGKADAHNWNIFKLGRSIIDT